MPTAILRPHFLGFKNTILGRVKKDSPWQKHLPIVIISLVILSGIFLTTLTFLTILQKDSELAIKLTIKLTNITLLAFFILLMLSNLVTALGVFFCSKDLPLLLTVPISPLRFYLARLVVTCCNASWVLALFMTPVILAYYCALDLHFAFFGIIILLAIPFLTIPTVIASALVTIVVNIIPISRLQILVVLVPFIFVAVALMANQHIPIELMAHEQTAEDSLRSLLLIDHMTPLWMPSQWAGDLIASFITKTNINITQSISLLLATLISSISVGYLIFNTLFMRGWTISCKGRRNLRVQEWPFLANLTRTLFPFNPSLRALFGKERRMFLRDPTQCVQLCLLLTLGIVYLYNLKTLRSISMTRSEAYAWWQTLLCVSNIALGGCVLSAIATRFIFPTISLEGQAYWIVRSAPITIRQLLYYKFFIWLCPLTIIAMVLMISGAWAIQVSLTTVFSCALISISLSVGLVGLAIGIGATYATFDWDTPTQASASIGNLALMLLSLALILVTLIPSSILIVIGSVPGLYNQLKPFDFIVSIGCTSFLTIYINIIAARWALNIGEASLARREE